MTTYWPDDILETIIPEMAEDFSMEINIAELFTQYSVCCERFNAYAL